MHGDVKSGNVLVTSSTWVLLADMAPFKARHMIAVLCCVCVRVHVCMQGRTRVEVCLCCVVEMYVDVRVYRTLVPPSHASPNHPYPHNL